jgi:uncharacterized protein YndB with AHSA1/START domain
MHGPDGGDYPNVLTYDEVKPPNRLVYTHHESKQFGLKGWQMINTFEKIGAKTKVTMHALYATPEEYEKHVTNFHAREGAEQMLERLEAFVTESQVKGD